MKLVVGSAQLGINYDLYNNKKISFKEFEKIKKLVPKSKIIKWTGLYWGNKIKILIYE